MYQNTEALYETGLFWKQLGRHDRAYRYFYEAAVRHCPNSLVWIELMKCTTSCLGSASLVREIYSQIEDGVGPDSKAYKIWCEQAVVFAPNAVDFEHAIKRLIDHDPDSNLLRGIDQISREDLGFSLDQLCRGEALSNAFLHLFAQYHIYSAQTNDLLPGDVAIHSIFAVESGQCADKQEEQGLLNLAQYSLLDCYKSIDGIARSHGAKFSPQDNYSLKERARILDLLTKQYEPGDALTLNRYGSTLLLAERPDAALEILECAYNAEPRPKPLVNIAAILAGKGIDAMAFYRYTDACSFYSKALEKLEKAESLDTLEPGDKKEINKDRSVYQAMKAAAKTGTMPLFPTGMLKDLQTKQRVLARKHQDTYKGFKVGVEFISNQVETRFNLNDPQQCYTCALELLEDMCPAFVADVLLKLKGENELLLRQFVIMGSDVSEGVIGADARETLSLCVLYAGRDIEGCACFARKLCGCTTITPQVLLEWMSTCLDDMLSLSVHWLISESKTDRERFFSRFLGGRK